MGKLCLQILHESLCSPGAPPSSSGGRRSSVDDLTFVFGGGSVVAIDTGDCRFSIDGEFGLFDNGVAVGFLSLFGVRLFGSLDPLESSLLVTIETGSKGSFSRSKPSGSTYTVGS